MVSNEIFEFLNFIYLEHRSNNFVKMILNRVLKLTQFFLLFMLNSVLCCGQSVMLDGNANTRFNILFISIDDLRTELNCYGASHIKSPNIDRLAAQGVMFENAHVQQAICMASRASIMTGIRPEKHAIYTGLAVNDVLPNALTLNRYFEQNGYLSLIHI